MASQNDLKPEEKQALERFPLLAQNFCEFIDACAEFNRQTLLRQISVHLAQLCEVGARLPWVNPASDGPSDSPDSCRLNRERSASIELMLREKLGELNLYWEVFDPTRKEEPVSGSVSMDIAEIYFDLKEALQLSESNVAREDVYFDWRLGFRSHWSRHAVSALKVALLLSDVA
jgi:Domain of unknown function (DUF5063)